MHMHTFAYTHTHIDGACTIASPQEDALNLLFLGDTNRMIAETPMNLVRD